MYRINFEVGPGGICDVKPFKSDHKSGSKKYSDAQNKHFRSEFAEFDIILRTAGGAEQKLDLDLSDGEQQTPKTIKLRCDQAPLKAVGASTLIRKSLQNYEDICIRLKGNNYKGFVPDEDICNTIVLHSPKIISSDYAETPDAVAQPSEDPNEVGENRPRLTNE